MKPLAIIQAGAYKVIYRASMQMVPKCCQGAGPGNLQWIDRCPPPSSTGQTGFEIILNTKTFPLTNFGA